MVYFLFPLDYVLRPLVGRNIYKRVLKVFEGLFFAMMQLFDQPEPLVSVGARPSTTIAPQALALLNSPQIRDYAHAFARQLLPSYKQSPESAAKEGYLRAIARGPDEEELRSSLTFLAAQEKSYSVTDQSNAAELALADFCQILFGLNEFVYVE